MLKVLINKWLSIKNHLDGISTMDYVFKKLKAIYKDNWCRRFRNNAGDYKEVWADAFLNKNLTIDEVQHGLDQCEKYKHRPIDLFTFINYCRPDLTYEAAYREAEMQMILREKNRDYWSESAIYHAAAAMIMSLNFQPYFCVKNQWKLQLDLAREGVASGLLAKVVPIKKKKKSSQK